MGIFDGQEMSADRGVDLFHALLPGWEVRADHEKNQIQVRTHLTMGISMSMDRVIIIPQENTIRELVEKARANAIAACGLQPVIDEQVATAFRRGEMTGYAQGKAAGREELYRELLAAKEEAEQAALEGEQE